MANSMADAAKEVVTGHHHSSSSEKPSFVPSLIRSTEERELLIEIVKTQSPVTPNKLEVGPLFNLVEHKLRRACHTIESGALEASRSGIQADLGIPPDAALLIENISCEMRCECFEGTKTHEVTKFILETLGKYTWEAKLVISLAAFSVGYSDFLLLSQAYSTNPVGLSMVPLRHLPSMKARSEALKTQLIVVKKLVASILDVTRLVVEFSEYPSEFRNRQEPLAIYWTIECVVAAATLTNLIATRGDEYMPPRELEPSKFTNNIIFVRDTLEKFKAHATHQLEEKGDYQLDRRIQHDVDLNGKAKS